MIAESPPPPTPSPPSSASSVNESLIVDGASPAPDQRLLDALNSPSETSFVLQPDNSPPSSPPGDFRPVYLFVNPTSGGNAASAFTSGGLIGMRLKDPNVRLRVEDIRDGRTGAKPGFLELKKVVDARPARLPPVIVVACGGDGTVMWAATEMWAHKVNCDKVVLGVLPYGTGNDFARSLDWNKYNAAQPWENRLKLLKYLLVEWTKSPTIFHDVWEVEVDLFPDGAFRKVDGETRKKKTLTYIDELGVERAEVKRTWKMNNYFSVGVESRIGLGFDRRRTKNQTGNKAVFAGEGFKKIVFKHTVPISSLVKELWAADASASGGEKCVFSTKVGDPTVLKPAQSLVAVNIPSFSSGRNACAKARGRSGGFSERTCRWNSASTSRSTGSSI
eukprot:Polyplicarium_translucidae@DN2046_c0_g1_i2.p1